MIYDVICIIDDVTIIIEDDTIIRDLSHLNGNDVIYDGFFRINYSFDAYLYKDVIDKLIKTNNLISIKCTYVRNIGEDYIDIMDDIYVSEGFLIDIVNNSIPLTHKKAFMLYNNYNYYDNDIYDDVYTILLKSDYNSNFDDIYYGVKVFHNHNMEIELMEKNFVPHDIQNYTVCQWLPKYIKDYLEYLFRGYDLIFLERNNKIYLQIEKFIFIKISDLTIYSEYYE